MTTATKTKKAQLTLTFPENYHQYKKELLRQKKEESLNISNWILSYCNKETTSTHLSIDYDNSNLVTPKIN